MSSRPAGSRPPVASPQSALGLLRFLGENGGSREEPEFVLWFVKDADRGQGAPLACGDNPSPSHAFVSWDSSRTHPLPSKPWPRRWLTSGSRGAEAQVAHTTAPCVSSPRAPPTRQRHQEMGTPRSVFRSQCLHPHSSLAHSLLGLWAYSLKQHWRLTAPWPVPPAPSDLESLCHCSPLHFTPPVPLLPCGCFFPGVQPWRLVSPGQGGVWRVKARSGGGRPSPADSVPHR